MDIAEAVTRVSDAMVAHVAGRDAVSQRINQSYMAFKAAMADQRSAAALVWIAPVGGSLTSASLISLR